MPCPLRGVDQGIPVIFIYLKLFKYMVQSLGNDGSNMSVCKRVEDGLAVSTCFYQLLFLQNTKLMGDGTLCHGKTVSNIADT